MNENRGQYMISTSDGHGWEYSYYQDRGAAYSKFEDFKDSEKEIHLYEWSDSLECYEVFDGWYVEYE